MGQTVGKAIGRGGGEMGQRLGREHSVRRWLKVDREGSGRKRESELQFWFFYCSQPKTYEILYPKKRMPWN
jgi:hypothetical protein